MALGAVRGPDGASLVRHRFTQVWQGSNEKVAAHPRLELDEISTLPVRLSNSAALAGVEDAEFGTVRDTRDVSDAVLSKQVNVLEAAAYLVFRKGYVVKRPCTWLSLTRAGHEALSRHVEALHTLIKYP
ncbi:transcriptional regulator [Pseudarthrobacter enclensis]|uniref:transcriptional regulator n=1 Tax=Pseudarthrobacter enclensis TaxID=993070 RepID=UPI003EE0624B